MVRGLFASIAAMLAAGSWAAPAWSQANNGTWTAKPNMTNPLSRFCGGVRSNNNIYFAGGTRWTTATSGVSERLVWRYNPTTNAQTQLVPQLPANQIWGAAAVVNDVLYCISGTTAQASPPTTSVYAFNMVTETFNAAPPPIPQGRNLSTAVAVGTDIYVMGGWDGTQYSTRNDRLSTSPTFSWTVAPALPAAAQGGGRYGGYLNNVVILAGGVNSAGVMSSTDLFDPVGGTWATGVAFMNPPMQGGGSCVLPAFNRFFCAGGNDLNVAVPATMEFHLPTRTWRRLADVTNPGWFNGLYTINSTPHVLNYLGGEGLPAGQAWLNFQPPQYGPNTPFNLYFRTLNGPVVGQGAAVGQSVLFGATVTDPDAPDSVALEVEVRPVTGTFVGTPTASGTLSSQGIVEVYHPILAAGSYKVRYRARDQWGDLNQAPPGSWVDLGMANDVDFIVDPSIVFDDKDHGAGDGLFGDDYTCAAGSSSSAWGLLAVALSLALMAAGRKLA